MPLTNTMLKRYGIFTGGSALGAVIDYAVTLAAVQLGGVSPTVALGCAMIASASATFLFHDRITFPGARGQRLKRYGLFMAWAALVFALRALLLRGFSALGLPLSLGLLGAIGVASVINFAISGRFIFAKARP